MAPDVRIRSWARGTAEEEQRGLLGYLSVFYGAIIVDGITVRRTITGKLTLSFPERRDARGNRHAVVRPVDDSARRAIEAAVFAEATLRPGVQP